MDTESERLVRHIEPTRLHCRSWLLDDSDVPWPSKLLEKLLVCELVGTSLKADISSVPDLSNHQYHLQLISRRLPIPFVLHYVCSVDVQLHILHDSSLLHPCAY